MSQDVVKRHNNIATMSGETTEDHKSLEKKKEDAVEDTDIKKEDEESMPSKVAQPSTTVVEPTQDSTGNDDGMETETANDETVKHDDEEKVDAPDPKIETESKLLKDLDDEAPKTFPQILMEILNTEEESDTIAWLPHGRSFSKSHSIKGFCPPLHHFVAFIIGLFHAIFERHQLGPFLLTVSFLSTDFNFVSHLWHSSHLQEEAFCCPRFAEILQSY